jgi:hypothetical protein
VFWRLFLNLHRNPRRFTFEYILQIWLVSPDLVFLKLQVPDTFLFNFRCQPYLLCHRLLHLTIERKHIENWFRQRVGGLFRFLFGLSAMVDRLRREFRLFFGLYPFFFLFFGGKHFFLFLLCPDMPHVA